MKLYQPKLGDAIPSSQADPYLIKALDGRYYLYTTGGNLFSSDALTSGWTFHGVCLDAPGQKNVWAPSVICMDGKYYMYYSSMNSEKDDVHMQTMRVAVAETPLGPFIYKMDLMEPFSIDPHVVHTPSGLYLFYCNNDFEMERAGTLVLCDKMLDPFTLAHEPERIILPTIDEEIFQRDRFKLGQHWHTIEGAFYFYHNGIHYLMYSGACYQNPTYFIGYCTAYGSKSDDLRKLNWVKYPDPETYSPLMRKNEFVEGVGHNSMIYDHGKWYVVYHGRDYGEERQEDTRVARIDQVYIDDGRLSVTMTP